MAAIKKVIFEERRSNRTGSPVVKKARWTIVNSEGRQIDGYFSSKANAERALAVLPKADR